MELHLQSRSCCCLTDQSRSRCPVYRSCNPMLVCPAPRSRCLRPIQSNSNGNGYHNLSDNSENEHSSNGAPHPDDGAISWREHVFPSYMQYRGDRSSFCLEWELMLQEQERIQSNGQGKNGSANRTVSSPMAPAWLAAREEALLAAQQEPILSSFLYASILSHASFEQSLSFVLANRLADATMLATEMMDVFSRTMQEDPSIGKAALLDLMAVRDRDPSCTAYMQALVFNKGYHALQAYRVMHSLWERGQRTMAYTLQSRVSQVLAVDIHPAARMGSGVLLDHGTGIVIGETACIGNNVSILQNVTLGGTGREVGDRHPKIRDGVLIGAGATILGNIEIGEGSMVLAGSLVLKPVKRKLMVAGSPAIVIKEIQDGPPALSMTQWPKSLDAEEAIRNWENYLQSPLKPQPLVPPSAPSRAPSAPDAPTVPSPAAASPPSTSPSDPTTSNAARVAAPGAASLHAGPSGSRGAAPEETVPRGAGSAPAEAHRAPNPASESVQPVPSTSGGSPRGTAPSTHLELRGEHGSTGPPAAPSGVEHGGSVERGAEKQSSLRQARRGVTGGTPPWFGAATPGSLWSVRKRLTRGIGRRVEATKKLDGHGRLCGTRSPST